jgi:hypothetical protein
MGEMDRDRFVHVVVSRALVRRGVCIFVICGGDMGGLTRGAVVLVPSLGNEGWNGENGSTW